MTSDAVNCIVRLTSQTSLRGVCVFARKSTKPVAAFLGVPYAEAPARFLPPKLSQLWTGSREATELGAICPQNIKHLRALYAPHLIPGKMSEDCLNLNIWTPSLDTSARLPVMVWLYGGAYINGCSNYYDGTAFASLHDVVFVSLNYRTGLLGFLSTGDGVVPGNMGLLDQREALRWVQKYIVHFGGDPDNVTLFGESAGALAITWHMLTKSSQGLFRRVILQSGTLTYHGSVLTKDSARRRFTRAANALGISDATITTEAIRQLQRMPVSEIVTKGPHGLFCPVIDGVDLTAHPLTLLREGKAANVDVVLGFNTNEGLTFARDLVKDTLQDSPMTIEDARKLVEIVVFRRYFSNHKNSAKIAEELWREYMVDCTDSDMLFQRFVELYGDVLFIMPTNITADILAKTSGGRKTFLYQFDHRPVFVNNPSWTTAAHGNEIPFVIGEPFLERFPDIWSDDEKRLSALLMSWWANFAKTGDPNTAFGNDVDICWPQYDSDNRFYAILRSSPSVGQQYRQKRVQFWTSVLMRLTEADPVYASKL